MAGRGALGPFDRHPANVGLLEASAAAVAGQATEVIDVGRVTWQAFRPAVSNWDGIAAPELRAAPRPVRRSAYQLAEALSWASVALRYWSGRISAFNGEVDSIVSELATTKIGIAAAAASAQLADSKPDADDDAADKLREAEAEAKRKWWKAYNEYIADGGQTAARMLSKGPIAGNVAEAQSVGLLPAGEPWNPLYPLQTRPVLPPPPSLLPRLELPGYDDCPTGNEYLNNVLNGAGAGAGLANLLRLPPNEGVAALSGGSAGGRAADELAKELDICNPPQIDPPKAGPPDPPAPPPSPGILERLNNARQDVNEAFDNAVDDAGDWLDDNLPEPADPDGQGGLPPLPIPVPGPAR